MTLAMARYTVRKNMKTGQVLQEKIEFLPDDPKPELAFLGKIYARMLINHPAFQQGGTTDDLTANQGDYRTPQPTIGSAI